MNNCILISKINDYILQNYRSIKTYTTDIIEIKKQMKMIDSCNGVYLLQKYFDSMIESNDGFFSKVVLLSNLEKMESKIISLKKQNRLFKQIIDILNDIPDKEEDDVFFADEIEEHIVLKSDKVLSYVPVENELSECTVLLDKIISHKLHNVQVRLKQYDKNIAIDMYRAKLEVALSIEEISDILEEVTLLKSKLNEIISDL